MQIDIFGQDSSSSSTHTHSPMAHKARPQSFEDLFGQEHLFRKYPFLKAPIIPSIILHGPPGCGKTTLANLLGKNEFISLHHFNAVLGGLPELKKLIKQIEALKQSTQKAQALFIDEIHRFNKTQQDALLPYVEEGHFILIGATTENPKFSINKALLSRVQSVELYKLKHDSLLKIITRANNLYGLKLDDQMIDMIALCTPGDARTALNTLGSIETWKKSGSEPTFKQVKDLALENARHFDKKGSRYYDVMSAFIKSMRASDEKSSILWLAVMLDGGQDPVYIARRLMIFASEDIGIADLHAAPLAAATLIAAQNIGMPEVRINLSHTVVYFSRSKKSQYTYSMINNAIDFVRGQATIEVPEHLKKKNFSPKG